LHRPEAPHAGANRHTLNIEGDLVSNLDLQLFRQSLLDRDRHYLHARTHPAHERTRNDFLRVGEMPAIGAAIFAPQRPSAPPRRSVAQHIFHGPAFQGADPHGDDGRRLADRRPCSFDQPFHARQLVVLDVEEEQIGPVIVRRTAYFGQQ
jgi:hypothetical protein